MFLPLPSRAGRCVDHDQRRRPPALATAAKPLAPESMLTAATKGTVQGPGAGKSEDKAPVALGSGERPLLRGGAF